MFGIDKVKILQIILTALLCFCNITSLSDTIFIQDKPKEQNTIDPEKVAELWKKHGVSPEQVPRVAIYDEMQNPVMLRNFKGKVVVVVFWASWCLECVEEIASLDKLFLDLEYNEVKNVELLPLSIDFKNQEFLKNLLESNEIKNLKFYSDKSKELMSYLGVHSLPTSFIISPDSKIIFKSNQHINWADPIMLKEITTMSESTQTKIG